MRNSTGPDPAANNQSWQPKARVVAGVMIIGIAVASLIWLVVGPAVEPLLRVLVIVAHMFLGATGVIILIGRNKRDRLVLTRRRWKYSIAIFLGATGSVLTILSLASPQRNLTPTLYSMFVGMGLSQLFESPSSANFKAAQLSETDAKAWRHIMAGLFVAGIATAAGGAAASALTGAVEWSAALVPVGAMLLALSASIWALLRARAGQSRTRT